MSEFRDSVKFARREGMWSFFFTLPAVIAVLVILGGIGFGLSSLGLIGHTVVERKVYENSYQRTAALRARIASDEAVLAEIERKLQNPGLDADTRYALEAQATAARVRIATAKGEQ